MFDLTGKTALVTGATGTIGGSIARVLHGQGATLAISGTRVDALNPLAGELGGRVHVCRAISPMPPPSMPWSRAPRKRWGSSTCWSPMPA